MRGVVPRIAFVTAFFVALVSLSAAWASLQIAWRTPTAAALLQLVAYAVVFAGSFLYLGFSVYAWDRAAGRVKRRIALYERFLREKP